MKRLLLASLCLALALGMQAQHQFMRVWSQGDSDRHPLSDIIYTSGGSQLSIGTHTYSVSLIDSVTMVPTVFVNFSGNKAQVDLGQTAGVTCDVSGADVVLTNTDTTREIEVILSGNSTNGSFTYVGAYKCKIHLSGLNLTSATGSPLNIQCGKRIDMILEPGTVNILADAAMGTQKACLYCKGHLELDGSGSLSVRGNARHAIATNEYLRLKKGLGSLSVTYAASDAIHAGQYFLMEGGALDLQGMNGDGIQAEVTNDATDELNGQLFIQGGSIHMTVAADDTKGIKSDADMAITGGTFDIMVTGAGSRGISCPTNMVINENHQSTAMTIYAYGGVYTDSEDNDSRCMGIKVGGNLTVSAGTVTVYNKGKARAIKVDGKYTKTGSAVVTGKVITGQ